MSATTYTSVLKSKHHFEILDGLRGVAALCVVVYHFMEIAVPNYEVNFIAHSYLAVDFFFCLSGFVIAYAYDTRLKQMGLANFIKLRLIRLHPLVIIGSVLGLLTFVFDPSTNLQMKTGTIKTFIMFVTSCLLIPYPPMPERYNNLFLLNPPSWSLMWEYVANIFYAVLLVRLNNKLLWVLVALATIWLGHEACTARNLSNGWGSNNVIGGAARVAFSFLAGMLLYRSNFIIRNKIGFIGLALLLIVAFVFPFRNNWAWLTDFVSVVVYFPLLVALGAGSQLREGLKKVCRFSGEISYPLYMVHYPFIWLFFTYLAKYKPPVEKMWVVIPVCAILLVAFAYIILKFVDEPIRKALRRKLSRDLN